MTDYACVVLLPEIVRQLTKVAPAASLEVQAWSENSLEDLRSGRMDTVITVAGLGVHQSLNCETIFSDKFACVVSARHPLNVQRVTLAQYLKYRHVTIAVMAGQQTLVDRPLNALSVKRDVGLSLPFFAPAIGAVANSDMILTIPRRLAFRVGRSVPVRVMAAPPEIKGFNYDMMWHPRLDDDPAHRWFRGVIKGLSAEMMSGRLKRPRQLVSTKPC